MTTAELLERLSDEQAARLTAYGEARNQPVLGLVAVLCVLDNRVQTKRWGKTWAAVALAPWQFSCWNLNDPNRPKLEALAELLIAGKKLPDDPTLDVCGYLARRAVDSDFTDPTRGATHYFAPAVVKIPKWALPPAIRTVSIAGHAFYKGVS